MLGKDTKKILCAAKNFSSLHTQKGCDICGIYLMLAIINQALIIVACLRAPSQIISDAPKINMCKLFKG
jgi:hypothetical protein